MNRTWSISYSSVSSVEYINPIILKSYKLKIGSGTSPQSIVTFHLKPVHDDITLDVSSLLLLEIERSDNRLGVEGREVIRIHWSICRGSAPGVATHELLMDVIAGIPEALCWCWL